MSGLAFDVGPDHGPWSLQPNEPQTSHGAFCLFRDQGPRRSVGPALVEASGLSLSGLRKWARVWDWRPRALAWDEYLDEQNRSIRIARSAASTEAKIQLADALWQTAAKGLVMWKQYLDNTHADQNHDQTKAPPISPADINRLADSGIKLSELLNGRPTEIAEKHVQVSLADRQKALQQFLGDKDMRHAMKKVNEIKKLKSATPTIERTQKGPKGP